MLHEQIDQLVLASRSERVDILNQLADSASKNGIEQDDLMMLFDRVFDVDTKSKPLHSQEKRFIVTKILLPNGQYVLDTSLIFRILSAIGYSRVYYQNGRKVKQRKLSLTIQNLLLEWLIGSLHLFGESVFNVLHQLLPMILHLLLFEYLRPLIANLIFLILSNVNKFSPNKEGKFMKDWQLQLIVDLYLKFPTDDALKGLLLFFHHLIPGLDYSKYLNYNKTLNVNELSVAPRLFLFPSMDYIRKLNQVNPATTKSPFLQTFLNQYKTFRRSIVGRLNKRRKQNMEFQITDIDILSFHVSNKGYYATDHIKDPNNNVVSIYDINSLSNLVDSLTHIKFSNLTSIFKETYSYYNSIIKNNFLIFKYIMDPEESAFNTLNVFLENCFTNSTQSDLNFITDRVVDILYLRPEIYHKFPSIARFLESKIPTKLSPLEIVPLQLKLLKVVPINFNLLHIIKFFKEDPGSSCWKQINSLYLHKFFIECGSLFNHLYKIEGRNAIPYINDSILLIYDQFIEQFQQLTPLDKLSFLLMLKLSMSVIDKSDVQSFSPNCVLPPILVIYDLLLANNSLIVSELCGYLMFCKSYSFADDYKSIFNAIIMDTINFIWRDKGFNYEDETYNKGIFLAPSFITKLPTLNVFGYSSLAQLHTVGNLFHNPAWSYIVTQIIWEMEDQEANITKRHTGPISLESVDSLINDPNHVWLNTNYEHLKLQILRKLDSLGYVGIADLLFNSLKSLSHTRISDPL